MKNEREQKLIEALEPTVLAHGFELVDVEFCGIANNRVIRIYLDKPEGIGIEDIAEANRWIDAIVEENVSFLGSYTLEVSSPGIDRPLRTLEHFLRYADEEVRLVTQSIDGRSNWTGLLDGVDGSDIKLIIDDTTYRLPFEKIKKAHLKGRVDFTKEKGTD